jgi:hypothetical protein
VRRIAILMTIADDPRGQSYVAAFQCPEHVKKTKPLRRIGQCPALSVPRPRCRPSGAPKSPGCPLTPFSRPKRRVGAVRRFVPWQTRRAGQGLGLRVGTSAAGDCMLRDLSTAAAISRKEREPPSCRPCAKSATL